MAIEKVLNTRLKLKIDTLENWTSNNPVLLRGEIALAEVSVNQEGVANYVPSVMAKVGDGTHAFNDLAWLYSRASDVASWAKEENKPTYAASEITGLADYIGNTVQDTDTQYQLVKVDEYNYKLQSKILNGSWVDVTGSTIAIHNDTAAIEALQALVGETAVATQIANAIAALDLANTYDAKGAADQALTDAKSYTDTEVAKKVASVAAKDDSIVIDGTATAPTIGVKIDATAGNALELVEGQGLRVEIPDAAEYSIVKDATSGEYAAVYHLTKDGANIGTAINIPKDMVVQSGEVVTDPEGQAAGTYIKLVLQNVVDPLYINVGDLIEYVTSGSATGDMVVVSVSDDHKVTATITDGTITKAKLASDVQTSLGKADTALQASDAPGYNDILTKTEAATTYVAQESGKRLMTEAEGTKLAGIEEGAQANVIETVTAGTGLKATKTDKNVTVDIDEAVVFIFDCGTSDIENYSVTTVANDAGGETAII